MSLFRRKKKQVLFGADIEPSCSICRYISDGKCVLGRGESVCRKYEYDPIKREPKGTPPLGNFTEDDFKL